MHQRTRMTAPANRTRHDIQSGINLAPPPLPPILHQIIMENFQWNKVTMGIWKELGTPKIIRIQSVQNGGILRSQREIPFIWQVLSARGHRLKLFLRGGESASVCLWRIPLHIKKSLLLEHFQSNSLLGSRPKNMELACWSGAFPQALCVLTRITVCS